MICFDDSAEEEAPYSTDDGEGHHAPVTARGFGMHARASYAGSDA